MTGSVSLFKTAFTHSSVSRQVTTAVAVSPPNHVERCSGMPDTHTGQAQNARPQVAKNNEYRVLQVFMPVF
jgi:hypothetical protein